MDSRREHEEPFGFDGRSLEEQLASLDSWSPGAAGSSGSEPEEPGHPVNGGAPSGERTDEQSASYEAGWRAHPAPPEWPGAPGPHQQPSPGQPEAEDRGHEGDQPSGEAGGTEILRSWPYEGGQASWTESGTPAWSPEPPPPPHQDAWQAPPAGGAHGEWPGQWPPNGAPGAPPPDSSVWPEASAWAERQQSSGLDPATWSAGPHSGAQPEQHAPPADPRYHGQQQAPLPQPPQYPDPAQYPGYGAYPPFEQRPEPEQYPGHGQYPAGAQYGSPAAPPHPGQDYPGGPPHPGAPQEQGPPPAEAQTSDSLSRETLLRGRRRAPSGGWRRALYKASGGTIHPGESPAELRRRHLVARGRTVVAGGHHRVAVLSLKGGVGKTTTTVGLGSTLAALRGDRVVAIDANPDRGTLSDKLHLESAATVRDLLNERDNIQRYADVRAFTSQAASRMEVLASDRDPAVSEAFSEDDYRQVARVLEHFYSICITDCGTGLLHSAMSGVLRLANQVVLVSSPSVDGARSASATLDWLEAHEFGDLVRTATVVLSGIRERSKSSVDVTRLEQHFASRCRAVVRIPYDPHLEEGAEVELDQLKPATRDAYLVLGATVGDGLGQRRSSGYPGGPGEGHPAQH